MTITPGYQFTEGELCTEQKLNLLGAPTAALDAADLVSIAGSAGAGGQANLLTNPDLSGWTRGVGPVNCPVSVKTFLADDWFVRVIFGTIVGGTHPVPAATYQRESVSGDTTQLYRARFGYSQGVSGEFTDLEFGQELPARVTAAWGTAGVTLAVDVENQTGTSFTPKARFYSCNVADDFDATSAVTTVNGVAATGSSTLGNGERRLFYFKFTAGALAGAMKQGGELCLVIPAPASMGGYVRVYGIVKAEVGQTPTVRSAERDASPAGTSTSSGSASLTEFLVNGDFSPADFTSGGANLNCPGGETAVALGWIAAVATGTGVAARDTATVPNDASGASWKFTGDATVTGIVALRQRLPRALAVLAAQDLVFQAQVRNSTGATLTPTLIVRTNNSVDAFGDSTAVLTQNLTNIADGDWVRVTHQFDAGALANWGNGASVELNFAAGALNTTGKNVRVAQASLAAGLAAAAWTPDVEPNPPAPLTGFRNLRMSCNGLDNTGTVTVDELVLCTATGKARRFLNVSTTFDLDGAGVGGLDTGTMASSTEYHLHFVADDSGVRVIASLSAAGPTLTTHPFRGRFSSFVTAGSGRIPLCWQHGRRMYIEDGAISVTYAPSGTTKTAVAITGLPSTAVAIGGTVGCSTTGDDIDVLLSGEASLVGQVRVHLQGSAAALATLFSAAPFRLPLFQTANLYIAAATAGSPTISILVNEIELG